MNANGLHFNFLFDISSRSLGAEPRSNAICLLAKTEIRIEFVFGFLIRSEIARKDADAISLSPILCIYAYLSLFDFVRISNKALASCPSFLALRSVSTCSSVKDFPALNQ